MKQSKSLAKGRDEIPIAAEQEEVVFRSSREGLLIAEVSEIGVSHEVMSGKRSERKPGPEIMMPVTTMIVQDVETESERAIADTNDKPMLIQSAKMRPKYLERMKKRSRAH